MKRVLIMAAAALTPFLCLTAERRGGSAPTGGDGSTEAHFGRVGHAAAPPVVIKMHRVAVPQPPRIQNPGHIVGDDRHVNWPSRDDRGRPIRRGPAVAPPQHHATIVRDSTIMRDIERAQRDERREDRFFWHHGRDVRWAHYYDRGIHWYGFYHGPSFYWCRLYADRWWWWDARFGRWVFWYDGFWWWQAAPGVIYVYVDNNYYPYEEQSGVVTVENPEVQPPASPALDPAADNFTSPDGARLVQVSGMYKEAFLYDERGSEPTFIKFLGRGVEKVRFSGGANGRPLTILLDFRDGTFALFDAQGQSIDAQAAVSASAELPGPAPGVSPPAAAPPPESAPSPPPSPPSQ